MRGFHGCDFFSAPEFRHHFAPPNFGTPPTGCRSFPWESGFGHHGHDSCGSPRAFTMGRPGFGPWCGGFGPMRGGHRGRGSHGFGPRGFGPQGFGFGPDVFGPRSWGSFGCGNHREGSTCNKHQGCESRHCHDSHRNRSHGCAHCSRGKRTDVHFSAPEENISPNHESDEQPQNDLNDETEDDVAAAECHEEIRHEETCDRDSHHHPRHGCHETQTTYGPPHFGPHHARHFGPRRNYFGPWSRPGPFDRRCNDKTHQTSGPNESCTRNACKAPCSRNTCQKKCVPNTGSCNKHGTSNCCRKCSSKNRTSTNNMDTTEARPEVTEEEVVLIEEESNNDCDRVSENDHGGHRREFRAPTTGRNEKDTVQHCAHSKENMPCCSKTVGHDNQVDKSAIDRTVGRETRPSFSM